MPSSLPLEWPWGKSPASDGTRSSLGSYFVRKAYLSLGFLSVIAGAIALPAAAQTAIDGAALYTSTCAGCHGPLATSAKLGRTAAQITAAGMTWGLSAAQIQAIAAALAVTPPPPAACTYTYNAWAVCQSNGTQTRTVASSSPSG